MEFILIYFKIEISFVIWSKDKSYIIKIIDIYIDKLI